MVECRLLDNADDDEMMQVAAEFLCVHSTIASPADVVKIHDRQLSCEQAQSTSMRHWVVRKVYIDGEGLTRVVQWSVRYRVHYTCSAGKYAQQIRRVKLSTNRQQTASN